MAGTIQHKWNGTILTITSDSGTSSCDLKGDKGDVGIRGPQGVPGDSGITPSLEGYATEQYVLNAIANSGGSGGGGGIVAADDGNGNITLTAIGGIVATDDGNGNIVLGG